MATSALKMPSAVTLLTFVLLAALCSSVKAAYFYNKDANSNTNKYPRTTGHYSQGVSTQPHTMHHKHHHGSNGRLHQAAVGIIGSGRLVPYTAGTITSSSKLSPLDRLINRLDSEGRKPAQSNAQSYGTRFDQANGRRESYLGSYLRRDHVSPSMLRSSADRRYAQVRSHVEDSYDDDIGDDEENDDGHTIGDEEEDEEEDEDDEDEENEEERLNRGRHQHPHRNHKSGYSGDNVTWVSVASALFSILDILIWMFLFQVCRNWKRYLGKFFMC
jgi:hypothetical protein